MSFDLVPSICKNIGIYTNNNDINYNSDYNSDYNSCYNCDCDCDCDSNSDNDCNNMNKYSSSKNNSNNLNICSFDTPFILFSDPVKKKMTIPLLVLFGINTQIQFAKTKIIMEKKCPLGLYCPHKTNPMKCPYNHHETPDIINPGDVIPSLLCRYERPWKKQQNGCEPLICMNPNCWYNHGQGRAERLQQSNYYKYEES
jgi:hypothetical protein